MSLFGKILAVLNVFGMLGLLALALMTYAKRQAWEYASYRHDLLVVGLPLHKEEVDEQGYLKYQNVGQQTQKELFPTNPVTTQKEEVERVQKVLQAKLAAVEDKQQQAVLLTSFLLPLAQTNAQRERLLSIRTHLADAKSIDQLKKDMQTAYTAALKDNKADPKKPIDAAFADQLANLGGEPRRPFETAFDKIMTAERAKPFDAAFTETLDAIGADLKEQFDNEFKAVLENQYVFKEENGAVVRKEMTPDERKDQIATLLFSLVPAEAGAAPVDPKAPPELFQNPSYKRFINVVGLAQADRTMNQQAVKLTQIISDLDYEQGRDRTAFAVALTPLLEQARDSARANEKLTAALQRDQQLVQKQEVLVAAKRDNVMRAENELQLHRETMATKLAELRKMSDKVFEIRVKVRDASVANQEHERTIRRLEGWRWLPFVGGSFLINREEP